MLERENRSLTELVQVLRKEHDHRRRRNAHSIAILSRSRRSRQILIEQEQ